MRSGTYYAGTDFYENQSQTFWFSAARVGDTRDVKVSWWMTTECNDGAASPTYYLCYKQQRLVVNGFEVLNWTGSTNPDYPTYYNGDRLVWRGFTDSGSYLDKNYNGKEFYDVNGDYTGVRRYVQVLGTKWKTGNFTKTADINGNIQFSVSGSFGWYGHANITFSKTFTSPNLLIISSLVDPYFKCASSKSSYFIFIPLFFI